MPNGVTSIQRQAGDQIIFYLLSNYHLRTSLTSSNAATSSPESLENAERRQVCLLFCEGQPQMLRVHIELYLFLP